MISFIPLITPFLLGFLFCCFVLNKSSLPYKNFLSVVLAPAAGFGIISLVVFFSHIAYAPASKTVSFWSTHVIAVSFLIICLFQKLKLFKTRSQKISQPAVRTSPGILKIMLLILLTCGFIYALYMFFAYFLVKTSWNPLGGWDTMFFWHLKARFLTRDPSAWEGMFSPFLDWSNRDYPLLMPGIVSWGWHMLGQEFFTWPIVISAVYMLSLSFFVMWYIASYRSWLSALTASAFLLTLSNFQFWSSALYSDIPAGLYMTLGIFLLVCALRHTETSLFFLCGFFSGLAIWTKNEGALFSLLMILTVSLILWRSTSIPKNRKFIFLISFFLALSLPAIAYLYMKLFLSGAQPKIIQERGLTESVAALGDWARLRFTLLSFTLRKLHPRWNGLWIFFAAAVFFYFLSKKRPKNSYQMIPLILILLMECGYTVVFMLAPNTIEYHTKTAASRLLLQVAIPALIFTFETFGLDSSFLSTSKAQNTGPLRADNTEGNPISGESTLR